MARLALACAAALLLAGCGSAANPAAGQHRAGWTTYRDGARAFSVSFPSGWHRARRGLTPHLTDPAKVLALTTYPLPHSPGRRCAHVPEAAARKLGSHDALLVIDEIRRPPKALGVGRGLGDPQRTELSQCAGRNDIEEHQVDFVDVGRGFTALVAFGRDVSQARRAAVARVLRSFDAGGQLGSEDMSVTLPDGWAVHDGQLASAHYEVLVASSFPIPDGRPDGNCTPRAALDAMPPGGAWLYVFEHGPTTRAHDSPPRPTGAEALRRRAAPYECLGRSRMVRWHEDGRRFQAHLYLGRQASPQRRRELAAAFDSLVAER